MIVQSKVFLISRIFMNYLIGVCPSIKIITMYPVEPENVKLIYVDDLSGVFNRRYLRRLKEEFISDFIVSGTYFTIAVVDIDKFKNINDTHGHLKGDEVIAAFAGLLKEILRKEDIIVRYGGDEFLIVQKGLKSEDAFIVWDGLVKRIKGEKIGGVNVSISVGLASFPTDGHSYEELFLKADERLYIAKRTGRGKVGREELRKVTIPPKVFVDRKEEASSLKTAISEGDISLVSGEAGIGKTRLIREVVREFRDADVLWSDCIAVDSKLPYYPLRELVKYRIAREGLKVLEDMPVALKIEIGKIIPEVLEEIEEKEVRTLGQAVDKYRLYEAFGYVLNLGSKKKIIVIDNIQWIDKDSIDALKYVLLSSKNVVFIMAERSGERIDYIEQFINGIRRTYPVRKIELHPMEESHIRAFVETIVGKNVESLEDYVIPRCEGNPFYIEELVKTLYEEGYLAAEGDDWVFNEPDEELLPGGIEGVIKEKFANLSHEAKELLKVVSVSGKGYIDLLKDILGYNEGRVFGLIEEGIKSTLIRENDIEDCVEFKYGMARQIIYSTELNGITRRHLHKKVAEWLEKNRKNEAEEIAYHYYKAGVKEKVVEYGELAGDKANSLYAEEKALDFYEWAEEGYKEGVSETSLKNYPRVLIKKASVLRKLGYLAQAEEFLKKALEFAKTKGLSEVEKLAEGVLENVLWNLGKLQDAMKHVSSETGGSVVEETVHKSSLGEKDGGGSLLRDKFKKFGKMVEDFDKSHGFGEKIRRKLKDSGIAESNATKEAATYYNKAKGLFGKYAKKFQDAMSGNVSEKERNKASSVPSYMEGSELAIKMGYRLGEDLTIDNIAVLLAVKGDFDNAEKYLLQSIDTGSEDLKRLSYIYNNLGLVYKANGKIKSSLKNILEAEKIAVKIVDKVGEVLYKTNMGAVLSLMGSYSTAMELLEDAYFVLEKIHSPGLYSEIVKNTLRVYIEKGDFRKALLVLNSLEEDGLQNLEERDYLMLKGEVLLQNGQMDAVLDVLKRLEGLISGKVPVLIRIDYEFLKVEYYLMKRDYESAKSELDKLYYLLKNYPDKIYLADYYRLQGVAYCPSNKVKSLKLFNTSVELYKQMELKHKADSVVEDEKRCYSAT